MNSLKTTKGIIDRYELRAKKFFGQNFLVDDDILEKISNLSETDMRDLIIEIGPGIGNLTYYLKQKSNLLLFEIDKDMIRVLQDRFDDKSNLKLVFADILKVDIDKEIKAFEEELSIKFRKVNVVANLPYYIISPILFKLLENSKRIDEIIVMVQNEVADRINANVKTKDYGVLTIMMEFYAKCTKQLMVLPECFIPAPKVTSAVVKIEKENKNNDVNVEIFRELVQKSFLNRRKKMINSLCMNNFMNLSKEDIKNIFVNCNLAESVRAEELTIHKYIEIANYIESNVKFC